MNPESGWVFVQNFTDSDSIVQIRDVRPRLKDVTLIKKFFYFSFLMNEREFIFFVSLYL